MYFKGWDSHFIGSNMYKQVIFEKWFVPNKTESMLLYPIPLWEPREASILDGFGDKVCSDIQTLLEKHAESLKLDPKQLLG